MIRRLAVASIAVLLCLALAPAASASFPGGNGTIAYTTPKQQIAVVKTDGTGKKVLTNFSSSGFVEAPMFSADGAWIVFDGDNGGNTDLFVMRADGSHLRKITHNVSYEWSPSWSPDGRWIVFATSGGGSPIAVVHPDGTNKHLIGTADGEFPRFSPDGRKIVYGSSDGQIHVMKADGSHDHAVTTLGGDYPDWSPNGLLIGYTSSSSGSSQVWIMHADGTHNHQVTTGGADYSPVFSPNGALIAYSTGNSGLPVWVAHVDGTHPRKLVASEGQCCLGWQPLP